MRRLARGRRAVIAHARPTPTRSRCADADGDEGCATAAGQAVASAAKLDIIARREVARSLENDVLDALVDCLTTVLPRNPAGRIPLPTWPARVVPPKGAPNILLIMTDDVGLAERPSRSPDGSCRALRVDQASVTGREVVSISAKQPKASSKHRSALSRPNGRKLYWRFSLPRNEAASATVLRLQRSATISARPVEFSPRKRGRT